MGQAYKLVIILCIRAQTADGYGHTVLQLTLAVNCLLYTSKNARGLRDAVRRQVEDQLASALVFHRDQDIQAIALTAGDDGVQLQINP